MNIAFIPVRGGSKSIHKKNIRRINGKPLVYWCMKSACECEKIDQVYVSTEDDEIKEVVLNLRKQMMGALHGEKIQVIGRTMETATDDASTESAMLEFANAYDFDNVVLIQATSPLVTSEDLSGGFTTFEEPETDSVLSVVRQKRFIWNEDETGVGESANYDYKSRPRRQDFDGFLMENGAFYITSRQRLMESGNRLSGIIRCYVMPSESAIEIDEEADWRIVETFLKERSEIENQRGLFRNIKAVLTDCDGCLTDGGMYYSEYGDELKKFNTRDWVGFKLLKEGGILTGLITSENVSLNMRRANKMQLDYIRIGCKDKKDAIMEFCEEYGLTTNEVCYVGDDLNDIPALDICGLACCPNDAIDTVKRCSDLITCTRGGEGVIREIADVILAQYS